MRTATPKVGTERVDTRLNRRQLMGRLAAAGFSAPVIAGILAAELGPAGALAQDATPVVTDDVQDPAKILDALGKDPRLIPYGTTNFGMPLELVDGLIVPNDLFFVRSNGPTPAIDPADWRLSVTGMVDQELELSLDDLKGMRQRQLTAFLECSGDSRSRFEPLTDGTQWGNTAIGNAEWTGISVREILTMAGVQEGAVDLVSQGGDFADMQRGLPLTVASDPDTMVVWEMNGEPLPVPNGGPARLFVPGWGGIASTKWLVGLDVIGEPFTGSFNTERYVIITEHEQITEAVQVMPVKSVISSPMPGEAVAVGSRTIAGYAWSGNAAIRTVEVSTDGGASWEAADITLEAGPRSWVRFEYPWEAEAGPATLQSRATDARALQQPYSVPWNQKGYLMNAVFEVPVNVS